MLLLKVILSWRSGKTSFPQRLGDQVEEVQDVSSQLGALFHHVLRKANSEEDILAKKGFFCSSVLYHLMFSFFFFSFFLCLVFSFLSFWSASKPCPNMLGSNKISNYQKKKKVRTICILVIVCFVSLEFSPPMIFHPIVLPSLILDSSNLHSPLH